jgi:hypothetical protein
MDGSEPPSLDLQDFDTHLILFLVIIDIHVIGCLLYPFFFFVWLCTKLTCNDLEYGVMSRVIF